MEMSVEERRPAYRRWLRTGLWADAQRLDAVGVKFNPYHDPRNGQFTFAPGGLRSLDRVVISDRNRPTLVPMRSAAASSGARLREIAARDGNDPGKLLNDGVYRPNVAGTPQQIQYRPPRGGIGSNSRAFQDPMTLEQTFPGLRDSPGGAILSLADNLFDFRGPARELTTQLSLQYSSALINEISRIDPSYRFDSLGFPQTLQGQINQLNGLRFERGGRSSRS